MKTWQWSLIVLAVIVARGCSCNPNRIDEGGGDGDGGIAGGGLKITPAEVTLDVRTGAPAPTQVYTARDGDDDVSSNAFWSLDDSGLGMFSGTTFGLPRFLQTFSTRWWPSRIGGSISIRVWIRSALRARH